MFQVLVDISGDSAQVPKPLPVGFEGARLGVKFRIVHLLRGDILRHCDVVACNVGGPPDTATCGYYTRCYYKTTTGYCTKLFSEIASWLEAPRHRTLNDCNQDVRGM